MLVVVILSAPIIIEKDNVWHEITINKSIEIAMVDFKEINKDILNELTIDIPNELTANNSNEYSIASTSKDVNQKEELAVFALIQYATKKRKKMQKCFLYYSRHPGKDSK